MQLVTQYQPINMVQPINRLASLNRGLVSWWLCLPGTMGGARWLDIAGRGMNANHGTLTNMDPTTDWLPAAGRPGGWGALNFTAAGDHVNVGTGAALDITGDITVCCWVKTTLVSTYKEIINSATGGSFNGWGFGMGTVNGTVGWWQLGQPAADWVTSTGTYNNGLWRHIAAVHRNSTVTFYIDGKFDVSRTSSATRTVGNIAKTIGGNLVSGPRYHPGQFDSLKVYNRALTAREIELEVSQSKLGYPDELTRVLFPLTGGASAQLADSGIGLVDFTGTALTTRKSVAIAIALEDLLGTTPTARKSVAAAVAPLEHVGQAATTRKSATAGQGAVDLVGRATTGSKAVAAARGPLELLGIAPTTSRATLLPQGAVDLVGRAVSSLLYATPGIGAEDVLGIPPTVSRQAGLSPAVLEVVGIAPTVTGLGTGIGEGVLIVTPAVDGVLETTTVEGYLDCLPSTVGTLDQTTAQAGSIIVTPSTTGTLEIEI